MDKLAAIRMAVPDDARGILAVYAPYILDSAVTFEYEVPSLDRFKERIAEIVSDMPYVVCEVDGEITGYAYASHYRSHAAYQWDCELSVYVKEDSHRGGIGRRLYEILFSILKEMNYENAYSCITTPNPQSVKFHEAMGFAKCAYFEHCGFKHGKWYDVTWMERRLQENIKENDYRREPGKIKKVSEIPAKFMEDLFAAYENDLETSLQNDLSICESFLGLLGL